MLAVTQDPTIASVFAPKTRIHDDGTVEGYASLFGAIDQARDMVMRGAFAQTLRQKSVRRVPMLFQHDPAEPVGVWLDLTEDFRGLRARGKLIPDVVRARDLRSLLNKVFQEERQAQREQRGSILDQALAAHREQWLLQSDPALIAA